MEELNLNLSEHEFSKGRKILLWVFGSIFMLIALWALYLKLFVPEKAAANSLIITAFSIGGFVYFIAILSTARTKQHFFKIDSSQISYRFGLLAPSHKTIDWTDVKKVFVPKKTKSAFLVLKSGTVINLNLSWIEKKKSRLIRKRIYHTAKEKNIDIHKSHPKQK